MKRAGCIALFLVLASLSAVTCAAAENEVASSIRDLVITEKKPFSFRNGISWGMNPQQVLAIENIPVEQRSSSEWSVMLSESPVQVSRFTADLVYMFRQGALRMITYEFQKDCSALNYQYLIGALTSLYGESRDANPIVIKGWMDRVYQNYYQQERISGAKEWQAEDSTGIYLYYFKENVYAILYVCPESSGANGYDTSGL